MELPNEKADEAAMVSKEELAALIIYFQLVGIIYSVSLFALFGLNYADYAAVDDFIFATFKEPLVFIVCLAAIVIFYKKWIRDKVKNILVLSAPVLVAVGAAAIVYVYVTSWNTSFLLSNTGLEVEVQFKKDAHFDDDNKLTSARIISRAGDFFFFYDVFDAGTRSALMIIPQESIIVIRYEE